VPTSAASKGLAELTGPLRINLQKTRGGVLVMLNQNPPPYF
jgi:hypothetical protein